MESTTHLSDGFHSQTGNINPSVKSDDEICDLSSDQVTSNLLPSQPLVGDKFNTRDYLKQEITNTTPTGEWDVEQSENVIDRNNENINEGEFDIFFSHSSKDGQWVEKIIEKLQNEPFSLKCCHHSKDFVPGLSTIANIEHFLQVSKKTVFFFSPNFNSSPWSMRELEICQVLSAEKNASLIIPVLYEDCELPISMRTTNYIDARCLSYDEVCEKIAGAFKAGPLLSLPTMIPPIATYRVPDYTNGVRLAVTATAISKFGFSFQEDLAREHIDILQNMKITAPAIVYNPLAAQLNKTWMLKVHNLLFFRAGQSLLTIWICCICVLLMVVIASATTVAQQSSFKYWFALYGGFILGGCSLFVGLGIAGLVILCLLKKQRNMMSKILVDVNMKYHERHNVLVHFQERQSGSLLVPALDTPHILMIRYDLKLCKEQLTAVLQRRYMRQIEEDNDENLQNDIVQQASTEELNRCLREKLPHYITMLLLSENDKVMPVKARRHEVINDVICFCQYVEQGSKETGHTVSQSEEPTEETSVMRINDDDDEDIPLLAV